MKTEYLIDVLSSNVEPIDHGLIARGIIMATLAAAAIALGAALLALGIRPDLTEPRALSFLFVKGVFAASVVALAAFFLTNLARPGSERKIWWGAAAPFLAIMVLGAISLGSAPTSHWEGMIVGDMWFECLISIPIIAVVPFVVIIWVMRRIAAPTDLIRTGALAGLLAGGVSAMGYAVHCKDDSLPFVALWYGGTVVLCMLSGAILGPKVLRW